MRTQPLAGTLFLLPDITTTILIIIIIIITVRRERALPHRKHFLPRRRRRRKTKGAGGRQLGSRKMKKRYVDASRLRKMKKLKISEKLSESAYTFLKFMAMWMLVLLADFILEFRLEYLWPCWLFFGSVYTTFHCHGLVICAVFVCAAFTLDIFCLIFVPLHWLFFVASTYVVFNYIWHTEKGLCISTVSLWILLVYTEASLRLKDLKTSHVNLSHLFAAHCIGYPVVYMGFDATCYFTNIFKLRIQKAVQTDNDFHMQLLQHSLPPGLPLYPKMAADNGHSKWKSKAESSQYQCHNGTVLANDDSNTVDCLQIPSEAKLTEKATQEVRSPDLNRKPLLSKNCSGESRELVHSGTPGPESSTTPEKLPQEEQGSKTTRAAKNSSPKTRRNSTATPSPPGGRTERKQRPNWKTVSPNRDGADKNASAAQNQHAEQLSRLEQEVRKLRGELQVSRHSEQELRSHVCNLTNSERSLRPEVSLLRQSNMLLQSKILCLTKTKQRDKQTSAMLEKKTRAETEARLSLERQLVELQTHKADEAARSLSSRQENTESQMLRKRVKDLETEYKQLQLECQVKESRVVDLENDVEALGKFRCVEKDTDMLLSTLSVLQEKAQHLEYNLSAETRIKLDLFSALGDARRQLEIAQDKLMKQEREISHMKQKIAEVMAVSPAVSYLAPRPAVPQYLTKLLTSERYMLNPRALMYQCLKK
uniref:macoilin-1 isoform X2 n=1 Tax=Doryrhamphus excisus TaxID=161450 RepID=UPI0025ADA50F|nr:macoilin-1 isoform X2 [Doryrhamphus excisus]